MNRRGHWLLVVPWLAACVSSHRPVFVVYPRPLDLPMYAPEALRESCLAHGLAEDCGGEPSLGVDPATDHALMQMMLTTARIAWDDRSSPPAARWEAASNPAFATTGDPYLWLDPASGRVFVLQLRGSLGGSQVAVSEDDGRSWRPIVLVETSHPDKPSLVGGPYHDPAPTGAGARALYYCAGNEDGPPASTASARIECRRSDDGGLSWGPTHVIDATAAGCWQYHGSPAVGPDGTVYLPSSLCDKRQAVFVSRDNGETWVHTGVPGTDVVDRGFFRYPSVALDDGGRLYFAYRGKDGKAMVTTSVHGAWGLPVSLGHEFGIRGGEFPAVVGGTAGRAAVAFLGTRDEGDPTRTGYTGVWHLYLAFTRDGGESWSTVDLTPDDPVQRGCIGFHSTCEQRNLLDFISVARDSRGRVLVAFTDGCTSARCVSATGLPVDSRASDYAIARQVARRGLLASGPDPRARRR